MSLATSVIVCQAADQEYGLPILSALQVLRARDLCKAPRAPSFVVGVFAWHGEIVPLIDLPSRFAFPRLPDPSALSPIVDRTRFILVSDGNQTAALKVDRVKEILHIPRGEIELPTLGANAARVRLISGIYRTGSRTIRLLHLPHLLSTRENGA